MANETLSETRQKFEEWALKKYYADFEEACAPGRIGDGPYADDDVEDAWQGWQAASEIYRLQGLEEAAKIADETANEVGGKFAETHMLNTGLNKFREVIRGKLAQQ